MYKCVRSSYDIIPAAIIRIKKELKIDSISTSIDECNFFEKEIDKLLQEISITIVYDDDINSLRTSDNFEFSSDGSYILLTKDNSNQIISWIGPQSFDVLAVLLNNELMGNILIKYNQELFEKQEKNLENLQEKVKTFTKKN